MASLSVVIQAGGKSSRMGEDKALMPFIGETLLIEYIMDQIKGLGDEQFIISNEIEKYKYLGLPVFSDINPDNGPLGGIYSAIYQASYQYCLILACDMPFINRPMIDFMLAHTPDFDVVMPRWKLDDYAEPFRAIYSKTCLTPIREAIDSGNRRVISFFQDVKIRFIDSVEITQFDPDGLTFFNVNTSDDLIEARRLAKIFQENQGD